MNQLIYAKLGITQTTKDWSKLSKENPSNEAYISICNVDSENNIPISVVDSGTDITNLKFYLNPELELLEGEVVYATLGNGNQAFYQIVSAKITEENLESPQGLQNTLVTVRSVRYLAI